MNRPIRTIAPESTDVLIKEKLIEWEIYADALENDKTMAEFAIRELEVERKIINGLLDDCDKLEAQMKIAMDMLEWLEDDLTGTAKGNILTRAIAEIKAMQTKEQK